MTLESPLKPPPFNPTWLTVAAIVLSGLLSGAISQAVTSRDVSDLRVRQDADEAWKTGIERRLADDKLATREVLVGLSKDVETANKALVAIQQALMVRGAATLSSHNP